VQRKELKEHGELGKGERERLAGGAGGGGGLRTNFTQHKKLSGDGDLFFGVGGQGENVKKVCTKSVLGVRDILVWIRIRIRTSD
jgi:hypothetical protein